MEERRRRSSRRNRNQSGGGKTLLAVIAGLVIGLLIGIICDKTFLAPKKAQILSQQYEDLYKEAKESSQEGDYAGAITKLRQIGDDWKDYSKVEKAIQDNQEKFREDIFSQLEMFDVSISVESDSAEGSSVNVQDQIRLLLDAAPYLSGDEEYEKKLEELCGLSAPESDIQPETQEEVTEQPQPETKEEVTEQPQPGTTQAIQDTQAADSSEEFFDFDNDKKSGE